VRPLQQGVDQLDVFLHSCRRRRNRSRIIALRAPQQRSGAFIEVTIADQYHTAGRLRRACFYGCQHCRGSGLGTDQHGQQQQQQQQQQASRRWTRRKDLRASLAATRRLAAQRGVRLLVATSARIYRRQIGCIVSGSLPLFLSLSQPGSG